MSRPCTGDLASFEETVEVAQRSLSFGREKSFRQPEGSHPRRAGENRSCASEVARRREDLIVAQARDHDQQEQLKTAISKQVHSELAAAEIVADRLPEPSLMIFSRSKRRSGWRLPPRINHVHPMAYRKAPFYSRRARRAGPRTPDMPSVTARP